LLMERGLAMPSVRIDMLDQVPGKYRLLNVEAILQNAMAPLSHSAPSFPMWNEVRHVVCDAVNSVVRGEKPAKIALAEVEEKISAMLKE